MRGPRLASVALLACLALAACRSDPVGPVDPDDTATPSTTTSPTQTSPSLPDTATADTAAGAVEFTKHYIELLNAAAASGKVQPLREASAKCEGCDRYAALYEKTYADGGYFKNFVWRPVNPFADVNTDPAVVLVDISTAQTRYKLQKSSAEEIGPASTYKLKFTLIRSNDRWMVSELTQRPSGSR